MAPPKGGKSAELASIEPEPNTVDDSRAESPKSPAASDAKPAKTEPKSKSPTDTTSIDEGAKGDEPRPEQKDDEPAPAPPRRPARPERRPSAFSSNLSELRTAFPDSPAEICRGILVAASNNLESAFSGMLAISDDTIRPVAYVKEQINKDEELARKLAMSDQRRRRSAQQVRRSRIADYDYTEDARQNDRPYDEFQRGLNDTKQAVTSFWGNLKERLSGEINDDYDDSLTSSEPLKSQWFPRQPSTASRTSSHSAPRSESGGPRLPPRKPSRPTNSAQPQQQQPAKQQQAPAEPRSVNAFGDETVKTEDKRDEQEPDAFFIGESDDDDLGSLNEELESGDTSKDASTPASSEAKDKKTETESETKDKSDVKGDAESESKDKKKEETRSAKEMLSKFKSGDKSV